jgi:hypothetical protein
MPEHQLLPLPEKDDIMALYYALGYIAAFESSKAKNPLIRDGKTDRTSVQLWNMGNNDAKNIDK